MILRIKQCKYCPRAEQCDYRDQLKREAKGVLPKQVVSLNCKEYPKVFNPGDRVSLHRDSASANGVVPKDARRGAGATSLASALRDSAASTR